MAFPAADMTVCFLCGVVCGVGVCGFHRSEVKERKRGRRARAKVVDWSLAAQLTRHGACEKDLHRSTTSPRDPPHSLPALEDCRALRNRFGLLRHPLCSATGVCDAIAKRSFAFRERYTSACCHYRIIELNDGSSYLFHRLKIVGGAANQVYPNPRPTFATGLL